MLMTMFAGLGAASAASIEYEGVNVPVVQTKQNAPDIKVLIDVSDAVVFAGAYNRVTVQLPSNVELDTTPSTLINNIVTLEVAGGDSDLANHATLTAAIKSSRAIDLLVDASGATAADIAGDVRLLLTIRDLKVKSGSGDIVATFIAPSGSAFPTGSVTIAKIATGGKVTVLGGSVKNIGDTAAEIDTITLAETTAGVFEPGEVITLELSKGFKWVTPVPSVIGGWAFDGVNVGTASIDPSNPRVLEITIPADFTKKTTAGRISIGSDLLTSLNFASIEAQDDAKAGDVTVTVSSNKDSIEKTKIVVAKYGSYDVKVVEGTVEEVLAGRTEQEIGEFYIEEAIAGSLVNNRTIILELPSGVKWVSDSGSPVIETEIEDGDDVFGSNTFSFVTGSKERAIKITVDNDTPDEASKILFKNAQVKVDPGFEGDITVTVRGTAGVEGTVKVAEAKLPVTITAKNATKIVTGAPNQKVADIIIKETVDEAILDGNNNQIVIGLDDGYKFSKKPTVEVTEGDLEIDSTKLISNDTELRILIKYSSNEPSTITISDVYVTAYRYVPEGDVKATLVAVDGYDASALNPWEDATGSTALVDFNTDKSAGSAVIATCVTPADAAAVGEFRIGSNVYYLNGIAKVMDVAPYIKNSRTYVPMRYVGEMLGAEVVWDDAARTVTLTKGDTTVVFTIGSTSYTVNGEAKTADVAPEIANDRTMLPARFVAEAFGATVGWDATTQTVLIQQ